MKRALLHGSFATGIVLHGQRVAEPGSFALLLVASIGLLFRPFA